jgi:hypothetical protein
MKKITYLVIHCTATPAGREVTADEIRQWHQGPRDLPDGVRYKGLTYPMRAALPNEKIGGIDIAKLKGRGWRQLGYSDLIHLDGTIENLVPYDDDHIVDAWEITNGALGVNGISRHVVYAGGKTKDMTRDEDTRTNTQRDTMKFYIQKAIIKHPHILIAGHNQFQKKGCPSFNVAQWCKAHGIPAANICNLPVL